MCTVAKLRIELHVFCCSYTKHVESHNSEILKVIGIHECRSFNCTSDSSAKKARGHWTNDQSVSKPHMPTTLLSSLNQQLGSFKQLSQATSTRVLHNQIPAEI